MYPIAWFLLGLVAAMPLLAFADRHSLRGMTRILGIGLVVAALIYVGFAAAWGTPGWVGVELLGVLGFGAFYALAL